MAQRSNTHFRAAREVGRAAILACLLRLVVGKGQPERGRSFEERPCPFGERVATGVSKRERPCEQQGLEEPVPPFGRNSYADTKGFDAVVPGGDHAARRVAAQDVDEKLRAVSLASAIDCRERHLGRFAGVPPFRRCQAMVTAAARPDSLPEIGKKRLSAAAGGEHKLGERVEPRPRSASLFGE